MKQNKQTRMGGGGRFLALLLMLCMLLTSLNAGVFVTFAAEEPPASWDVGVEAGAVTAKLSKGVLTLSGFGDTKDYTAGTAPFAAYAGEIHTLVLEPGLTSLGDYLFYNLGSLGGTLTLPQGLLRIGSHAFSGDSAQQAPSFTWIDNRFTQAEITVPVEADQTQVPVTPNTEPADSTQASTEASATKAPVEDIPASSADATEPASPTEAASEPAAAATVPDPTEPETQPTQADAGSPVTQPAQAPAYRTETIAEQEIGSAPFYPGQAGGYQCAAANRSFAQAVEEAGYEKSEGSATVALFPGAGSLDPSADPSQLEQDGAIKLELPVSGGQITLPELPDCFTAPQPAGLMTYAFGGWGQTEEAETPLAPGSALPLAAGKTLTLYALWAPTPISLITTQTTIELRGDGYQFQVAASVPKGYALQYQWQVSQDYGELGPNATWTDLEGAAQAVYTRTKQAGDAQRFFRCQVTAEAAAQAAPFSADAPQNGAGQSVTEASSPVSGAEEVTVTYYAAAGGASVSKTYPAGSQALAAYPTDLGFAPPAGQTFDVWNTAADKTGTSYGAGASLSSAGAALTLYACWKASDESFSAILYHDVSYSLSNATVLAEGGALSGDWDYGEVRYLQIKLSNPYNSNYTVAIDLPVGMAIYGNTYTQPDNFSILDVKKTPNVYPIANESIVSTLKSALKGKGGESADLLYTIAAGQTATITVPVIYDQFLWDKQSGASSSNLTGAYPPISVTVTRDGNEATKVLSQARAKRDFGNGLTTSIGATRNSILDQEEAQNLFYTYVISSSQEIVQAYWQRIDLTITTTVRRDGVEVQGLFPVYDSYRPLNSSYPTDYLVDENVPGRVTLHADNVYNPTTNASGISPYFTFPVAEDAFHAGDTVNFRVSFTLTSLYGTQYVRSASRDYRVVVGEKVEGINTDKGTYAPHGDGTTLTCLGFFRLENNGSASGPKDVVIQFDTTGTNRLRVSAIRLPLPGGTTAEAAYVLSDGSTGTATVSTASSSEGAMFCVADLRDAGGTPYTLGTVWLKEIRYRISSIPALTSLYYTSGSSGTTSGGTVWGTHEGVNGNPEVVTSGATCTLTVYDANAADGEPQATSTLRVYQTSAKQNAAYLQTPNLSKTEIHAGDTVDLSFYMTSTLYPYTSVNFLTQPEAYFIAPQGVTLLESSVTASSGYGVNVSKEERPDGTSIYTFALDRGYGGYRYESGVLRQIPNASGIQISCTLSTDPNLNTSVLKLKDQLFVADRGTTNGLGGSYGSYRYQDQHHLIDNTGKQYLGGFQNATTASLTILPNANALTITGQAKLDNEGATAFRSGLDQPIYLSGTDRSVDYRLRVENRNYGVVLAKNFYYYIPIPKAGAGYNDPELMSDSPHFSLNLTGPVQVSGSNPQIYDVRYAVTTEGGAYDNGKQNFDNAGGFAVYYTAAELLAQGYAWQDVAMVKILAVSDIPGATDDFFRLSLVYGGEDLTAQVGAETVWASCGYQANGGTEANHHHTPTAPVAVKLKYQAAQEVALTAFLGNAPVGADATKTATVQLPALGIGTTLQVSRVETDNVVLVDAVSEQNKTDWPSSKANYTFSLTAAAGGSSPAPLLTDAATPPSWSMQAGQPFSLNLVLDNANALNDVTTARKVTFTLTDGACVEVTVTVTIDLEPAVIQDPKTTVDVGKFYDRIGGHVSSIHVTCNSAVTAQYVLPDMVPASYTGHTISWGSGSFPQGARLTLVDLTDPALLGYYHYQASGEEGAIPLSSFRKMGTNEAYTDRAASGDTTAVNETLLLVVDLEPAQKLGTAQAGIYDLTLTALGSNGVANVVSTVSVNTSSIRTFQFSTFTVPDTMTSTATVSGTVQPSETAGAETSHLHQKTSLVLSLADAEFPVGSVITYGGQTYQLSSGRFILPLGAINEPYTFSLALETPYAALSPGNYTLQAEVYVSATADGTKPFGGEAVAHAAGTVEILERPVYQLTIATEPQLLTKDQAKQIALALTYNAATSNADDVLVSFSVQKKQGSSYLTQNNVLSSVVVNGATLEPSSATGIIQTKEFFPIEGAETVTVNLNAANLEPGGTYRLLFQIRGKGDPIEVPYPFLILSE